MSTDLDALKHWMDEEGRTLLRDFVPEDHQGSGICCINHTCPACLHADAAQRGDEDPEDDPGYCLDAHAARIAAYEPYAGFAFNPFYIPYREDHDGNAH